MDNTYKNILIGFIVALFICNFYALFQISELKKTVENQNNNVNYRMNNVQYSEITSNIQKIMNKLNEQDKITSGEGYSILFSYTDLHMAKIRINFSLKEIYQNQKYTITLSSAYDDISADAILESGIYTVDIEIKTDTNYKAFLNIEDSKTNTTKSVLLIDQINSNGKK